jgi:hypothetical protein
MGNTDMSFGRLAELKAVRERIEELQERHWLASTVVVEIRR